MPPKMEPQGANFVQKRPHNSKNDRTSNEKRIEQELKLFSRLDHPNVIKIQEAYEDDYRIYFIMDDMKGGNLY